MGGAYGIFLDKNCNNNTVINTSIRSCSNYGIEIAAVVSYNSTNNLFINAQVSNCSYGVYLYYFGGGYVYNNTFINGSIHDNSVDDYWSDAYSNDLNYFINTNFTAPRKLITNQISWLAFANFSAQDVFLITKLNNYEVSRKLINWTKDRVEWNDTGYTSFTANHYLTNLWPNKGYDVYVDGSKALSNMTDSSGTLSTFSISMSAATKNIKVLRNDSLHQPDYSQVSVNTTVAGYPARFQMKWNDTAGLSHYLFSFDNCTGSFSDDLWYYWSGNPTEAWVDVTKTINSTLGCTIRWKVKANNTQGIFRESEIFSFKTSDIPKYNNLGQNKTTGIQPGDAISFYANWSDEDFLDTSIFSINVSGWQNTSYKFGTGYTTFSDGSSEKSITFNTSGYDNTTARLKLPLNSKAAIAKVNVSGNSVYIADIVTIFSASSIPATSSSQRKIFYTNGYYWAFWAYGNNLSYSTSSDGYTWSSPTLVVSTPSLSNIDFSVWTNGTHVFYARTGLGAGYNLTFRVGRISGNTISWNSEVVVIANKSRWINFPFVSVSSDGYPWIGYADDEQIASLWYPFVIKANDKDGTSWGTPFKLSTIDTGWAVTPLPLTGGNMYIIYAGGRTGLTSYPIKGRLWNGSMQNEESVSISAISNAYESYDTYSAVTNGDIVHLVFRNSTGIVYVNRTSSGWSPERLIDSGEYPQISVNNTDGTLHVLYKLSPYIRYCQRTTNWQPCISVLNLPYDKPESVFNASAKFGFLLHSDASIKFAQNIRTSYPSKIFLKVGNSDPADWYYDSSLTESNSPQRIDLNTTKLTQILSGCNCLGCSISGSDCIIPINVSTATAGKITLNNLYLFTSTKIGWSNFTLIVDDSWMGKTIAWKIFTNDTANNWNVTIEQYFSTGVSYVTQVGKATMWTWKTPSPGEFIKSGTPYNWSWQTLSPGSGRKTPQGSATNWVWGNE
jgi:hypothetical protein